MTLRRLPGVARPLLRRFSTDSKSGTLNRWLQEWIALPQVVVPDGTEPPTALSWLRRRGPPLPEAALHRLFRTETVRVYDPASQRVGRVAKTKPLPVGAMLLLPKSAVSEAAAAPGPAPAGGSGGSKPARPLLLPPAQERLRQQWLARLRASLLHNDADFLALNKPAGLATQGGKGVDFSLDSLMGDAFGGLPGTQGSQLRLVHRLDRQTTGALLVAKNPDAAAWLAAGFRDGSSSSSSSASSSSRTKPEPAMAAAPAKPASIRKTYWAVVVKGDAGSSSLNNASSNGYQKNSTQRHRHRAGAAHALPAAGSIDLPVPSGKEGSGGSSRAGSPQLLPAQTRYRVLHQNERLAWLELQPVTGRKHQLRLHCAQGLGTAILGDSRYGLLRSPGHQAALAGLQQHASTAQGGTAATAVGAASSSSAGSSSGSSPPLYLHCRRLEVRKPGGRRLPTEVLAPLPGSWRTLLAQQGWPQPRES